MRIKWRLLRQEILPTPQTLALLSVALGLALIGLVCAGFFAIFADVQDPSGTGMMMFSCFLLPVVLVLLIVATVRDKRPVPRALMWLIMGLLVGLSGLLTAIAMSRDPELGIAGSGFFFLAVCAPGALLFLAPAIYFAAKGWKGLKATLRDKREQLALELLDVRGQVTFAELDAELALDSDGVIDLIEGMQATDKFDGQMHRRNRKVYSAASLAAKRRSMLAILKAHGQIQVDELAGELGVPLDLLKEWLYDLVQQERFSGYINWEDGVLYSAEGDKLREAGRCPHCSGKLGLAGKGVIHCQYCGAEIFI